MVGTGHTPISRMRQPLESKPATTACLTISPEVRGSRPMTIVRAPVYVPNACAKRVNKVGVSDSPMTPRTPEILILRVGIGRMISVAGQEVSTGSGSDRVDSIIESLAALRPG